MTSRKDLGGNGAINHRGSSQDTFIQRLIASLQNDEQSTTISKKDKGMTIARDLVIILYRPNAA